MNHDIRVDDILVEKDTNENFIVTNTTDIIDAIVILPIVVPNKHFLRPLLSADDILKNFTNLSKQLRDVEMLKDWIQS